ncbi:glycoside hydrolase family 78 protein [Plantibacter flavus]|uniref:alpha-L-rhamnosidase n=1 Tax=Plantibacter flavus TaxID=150123 RepID=UPI003F159F66
MPVTPGAPRFERQIGGDVVGTSRPRLSWRGSPDVDAYEVEVTSADGEAVWRETVPASAHLGTAWVGPELQSREVRNVRVRSVAGSVPSAWSEAARVEAGLLHRTDWEALVVAAPISDDGRPILRRRFDVPGPIRHARLYVTYFGIGTLTINGRAVTPDVLAPGWQSYTHRIAVSTYDVAELLTPGENVLEIRLGDGWWAGRLGFTDSRTIYGTDLGAIAQLEITTAAAEPLVIRTDEQWRWTHGPTLAADLYDGEHYDARRELAPGSDLVTPERWYQVTVRQLPEAQLLPIGLPPTRRVSELQVQQVLQTPAGKTILDFGENLVGWLRLTARGPAGTTITLRHAEVLEDGELGVRPLRSAAATDRWILAGTGEESWEPSFTFHGFRYAEVEGWPEDALDPSDVTAIVVSTALPRTGWFASANREIDQLHGNVVRSMRGNFLSIPMDCPQRDERLGWTGDIAVFAPTAGFLSDTAAFLQSWLQDVEAEQHEDGLIPYFVPELPFPEELQHNPIFNHHHTAVWGDVATLVPFAIYEATGDVDVLRRSWALMQRWVDGVERLAGPSRVWDEGFQYGDWLDPTAPPEEPARGATETALVATGYFAHSSGLLARAAALLGDEAAHARYAALRAEIVTAFRERFVLPDGTLSSDSQTAYAIALQLDLVDDATRAVAGDRLRRLVRDGGFHVGTGFVGTPLILDALVAAGATDEAYELLLQREAPSWLYAVSMGATTIWERWDSMLPDGSIHPGGMTSFNHYAFGAVADWLHGTVAGLRSAAPGWTAIRIAPLPHRAIGAASASRETPFGRASVAWRLDDSGILELDIEVPDGVSAVLELDGHEPERLTGGRHTVRRSWPSTADAVRETVLSTSGVDR